MITQRFWIGLLLLGAVTAASAQERIMSFDHDKAGGPPRDWISDGEPWRVMEESQASSLPNVLMPPHSVLTGGSLTHLMISSATFLNGDVGMRFRITREDPPAIFGLLWSYADAANYEEVQINTQSNAFSLLVVHDGKPRELAGDSFLFTPNTWHLLQVKASPKQLTLYLDNEVITSQKTSLRKKAGDIGIIVVPNAPIQFDDFAWRGN